MYRKYLNICSYYNLEKVLHLLSPDRSKTVEILYVGTNTWAGTRHCAPVHHIVFRIWYFIYIRFIFEYIYRCDIQYIYDVGIY